MERRVKSALKGDFVTRRLSQDKNGPSHDQELLTAIVDCLCPVVLSQKGLASNFEARMLVDLMAAVGQAAFSPDFAVGSRQRYLTIFDSVLDR